MVPPGSRNSTSRTITKPSVPRCASGIIMRRGIYSLDSNYKNNNKYSTQKCIETTKHVFSFTLMLCKVTADVAERKIKWNYLKVTFKSYADY